MVDLVWNHQFEKHNLGPIESAHRSRWGTTTTKKWGTDKELV